MNIQELGNYFLSEAFVSSLIVIVITIILLSVIKKYLIKKVAYTTKGEQHQNTFVGVVFSLLQYAVVIGAAVIVLQLHGVNVTSIIAGLGIIATLIGLALQDTMKDIISGINIYNNNFYKVGDNVIYNDQLCEVKYFSARVTKFASITSGNTYTVCNSTITSMEKVKDQTLISLYFDFEDNKKSIDKCFEKANDSIQGMDGLKKTEYIGLCNINEHGLNYCFIIYAPSHKAFPIKVQFIQTLYEEFKKAKVSPSFEDEIKLRENTND